MRILQINAVYGHGSTGVIVKDIYELCNKSDIECFLASPDPDVLFCPTGYKIGNQMDHKIHAFLCRAGGKQAYYSAISTRKLCKYIDRISPDIVHLHNLHSNYIHLNRLLKFLAERRISVVVTLHDCWFYTGGCFHYTTSRCDKWKTTCGDCPRRYMDTPAYLCDSSHCILNDRKIYFDMIDNLTVTGVSSWITSEAQKSVLSKHKIVTIRNGVDTKVFHPCSSSLKRDLNLEDKFVILGPASKWLLKINSDYLSKFCNLLKDDEVLLLYGATDTETYKGLPANVITYGYIHDREELVLLYSGADVFANVSHEDSFSLINIEAQACGTPIVTFACTGLTDTIDNQCGYSVSPNDVNEMYDKIQMIRSELEIYSSKCRDYVLKYHDKNNIYDSYIKLYEEMVIHKTSSDKQI
ncbi:MAG: glycosyltransferase [Bacteroidaceae bacterium]|nr:glycosyltransferase [Bacteroidaceae bacterium]